MMRRLAKMPDLGRRRAGQPADRGVRHAERAGNIDHRLASIAPGDGFAPLVRRAEFGAAPRATDRTKKGKPRCLGRVGLVVGTCPSERWGPNPGNQPLGCGVTVTDWRLYTADHRHIDGGGNHNAQSR
jgi:hypothetical protein